MSLGKSSRLNRVFNGVTRSCSELRVASLQGPTHICSELLGVARSPALRPNRGLLIFARSYSKLLGVARSCALHPYRAISSLLGVTRSCSEQLCCCQLLPLQHTGACSNLHGEKRYLTNPTQNVLTSTFTKSKRPSWNIL